MSVSTISAHAPAHAPAQRPARKPHVGSLHTKQITTQKAMSAELKGISTQTLSATREILSTFSAFIALWLSAGAAVTGLLVGFASCLCSQPGPSTLSREETVAVLCMTALSVVSFAIIPSFLSATIAAGLGFQSARNGLYPAALDFVNGK